MVNIPAPWILWVGVQMDPPFSETPQISGFSVTEADPSEKKFSHQELKVSSAKPPDVDPATRSGDVLGDLGEPERIQNG